MSKESVLSSWLYSGRKGLGSGAGRERRGGWSLKVEKEQGKRKIKTRKGDNEWASYANSSLFDALWKRKHTKKLTRLVSKHNDLWERERERVTRFSLELGCDYSSVKVTWSWRIQYARYGHLWLRKHNLIAWITTQTFDIGLSQLCSCIGLKLLHKSSGPGCWRSPCSIFRSSSQVSW